LIFLTLSFLIYNIIHCSKYQVISYFFSDFCGIEKIPKFKLSQYLKKYIINNFLNQ